MIRVRCVNADGTDPPLVEGHVYEIDRIFGPYHYEIGDDLFRKERFIEISIADRDISDDRDRGGSSKWSPRIISIECPCGIHRASCDYHRP